MANWLTTSLTSTSKPATNYSTPVAQQLGVPSLSQNIATYNAANPKVLGSSTGSINNGKVPSSIPNTQQATNQAISNVNKSVEDYSQYIDQDYENAISALSGQESGLRGQADIATQQIGNEYGSTLSTLNNEQAVNEQGVQSQLSTGETSAKTGLQGARDLFRQTQQANIAQLSGLGISSSSVAEALAETLGVETARRIGSITGNLAEIRQNASKELSRIGTYFSDKKTQLEKAKGIEISKIQQGLISGINQINSARNQAGIDKAKSRYELISNARTAIDNINSQALQFEQSLANWQQSKNNALTKIVSNPEYLNSITNNLTSMNKSWAPPGWAYVPNVDANGQVTGYILKQKNLTDTTGAVPGTINYEDPSAY